MGLFKHPGSGIAPTPKLPSATYEVPPTPTFKTRDDATDSTSSQATSQAVEKLEGIGLKLVFWQGNCDANMVTTGKYDIPQHEGGMYALLLDNTFSRTTSKTATLVLQTHPTNSAPQTSQVAHHTQTSAAGSAQSLRIKASKSRPKLQMDRKSSATVPSVLPSAAKSVPDLESIQSSGISLNGGNHLTGVLQKRRRKRGQGYARRFFSLDFTTSTLSYYHDRNSLTIRGAVPLSLAAIATNPSSREISIDSGAEVWHLKTLNKKDFEAWQNALEFASKPYIHHSSTGSPRPDARLSRMQSGIRPNPEEQREWTKVEGLVSKITASRDLARTLAKDTDPKYLPSPFLQREHPHGSTGDLSQYPSSTDLSPAEFGDEYFQHQQERRPFWKRKVSGNKTPNGKRSASAQRISPSLPAASNGLYGSAERSGSLPRSRLLPDDSLHERCMQLLHDLDSVVNEFSSLIAESKERRNPLSNLATSRLSLESVNSQEFFDAEVGDSQLLTINHESDEEAVATEVENGRPGEHDDSSASELEDSTDLNRSSILGNGEDLAFPPRPKNFHLISPSSQILRRTAIPPPSVTPPSLIGFLRKNVGKDLSTISMPVSANEPISLLQKSAEALEYSSLLDTAASPTTSDPTLRLLHVIAFALSPLSSFRIKDRSIRKPFNPMLGETYELVREDKGFRFLAEKVSHRPMRLAYQADSERGWSLVQSPAPSQKFWGKSAELNSDGRVRLSLHEHKEHFAWTSSTCFLRNLIAGEKYIEPVGSLTVSNETDGSYALATFKAKGLWGGRSEEIVVQTFSADNTELPLGLVGKWTDSLCLTSSGIPQPGPSLWSVGSLVPNAPTCYGFSQFSAQLNEILPHERDVMAPTDSRFRPDQRAVEEGDVESAEVLKGKLEEGQRERRKVLEAQEGEWEPAWFGRVDTTGAAGGGRGEECWRLKGGRGEEGYWDVRGRGRKGWEEKEKEGVVVDVFGV